LHKKHSTEGTKMQSDTLTWRVTHTYSEKCSD